MQIPDGSMVLGSPGKIVKELDERATEMIRHGATHYVENGQQYRANLNSETQRK
jgi:carbonic anhydrase/acetyltransferase-like protein (isoleucine patch superfamily)